MIELITSSRFSEGAKIRLIQVLRRIFIHTRRHSSLVHIELLRAHSARSHDLVLLGFCIQHCFDHKCQSGQWRRGGYQNLCVLKGAVLAVQRYCSIVVDDVLKFAPADTSASTEAHVVGAAASFGFVHVQPAGTFELEVYEEMLDIGLLGTKDTRKVLA